MRDFILLIAVIAFMIGGYFVVRKIEEFFDNNYKGFDCDDGKSEETTLHNGENSDYPLKKKQ